MKHDLALSSPESPGKAFKRAANDTVQKPKAPPPFSIRLSAEERAYLNEKAGNQPLGVYIRATLLGDRSEKRRVLRKPTLDDQKVTSLLAALGESHLSSNLNQLARHANMGTLDVSRDVERELNDAYKAVIAMRDALFMALGMRSGGSLRGKS